MQDPESPVPLHVGQPRRVPEAFGERVAVDLQFGDLKEEEEEDRRESSSVSASANVTSKAAKPQLL